MNRSIYLYLTTLFFSLLLIIGCKKKDDDCPNYNCQNGGVCLNGGCACPEGYMGVDCSEMIPIPLMPVQIKVTDFPSFQIGGGTWDDFFGNTSPDIYIGIKYQQSQIYTALEVYNSAVADSVYVFDIPTGEVIFYEPDELYSIILYDRDNITPDLMGAVSFIPKDLVNGEALPMTFEVGSGQVTFEMTLAEY